MLRFGTDGVRGVALTELTPQYVASLGAAAADALGTGTWLIGRDTRQSGPVLEQALTAGLRSRGAGVLSCGMLPTPALAFLSQRLGLPAAMITASHNPYSDNGVKIFAAGGVKLSDEIEASIEALLADADSVVADIEPMATPTAEYQQHLVDLFGAGSLHGMSVVLDCANGAMSEVAEAAVRALGAETLVIHARPDGTNINAECGATHPASLAAAVLHHGADAGLAFDGDGDRVIAVDNRGHIVDGDRLIALGALQLHQRGELTAETVVVTVMSNLGFHRAMREAGIHVVATAVGDRYVLEGLAAGGFAIGGEQSGHIIYPHDATTGDGLLAGLRLLQFVHGHELSLHELARDVMTTYPQVLLNVRVRDRHPDVASELEAEIQAAEADFGGEGRVLVRASGTEPLIRVMVEASTIKQARAVAERLCDVVRARFGSAD